MSYRIEKQGRSWRLGALVAVLVASLAFMNLGCAGGVKPSPGGGLTGQIDMGGGPGGQGQPGGQEAAGAAGSSGAQGTGSSLASGGGLPDPGQIAGQIGSGIGSIARTAQGAGQQLLGNLGDVARNAGEQITDGARDVGRQVGSVVRNAGEQVGDGARDVGRAVGSVVRSAGDTIRRGLGSLFKEATTDVTGDLSQAPGTR
ncbi:MAG: hypothetical protein HY815_17555 [Candidatus Riflebacteria bacterium]|nr:hypothetical protein [Candidatus Riflebacteria bacterium]